MPNKIQNLSDQQFTARKLKRMTRLQLIDIAKLWPGHAGCKWAATTTENLCLLIIDAMYG